LNILCTRYTDLEQIFTTILNNKAATSIPAHVINELTPLHVPASQVPTIVTALANSDSATLAKYSTTVVNAAVTGMRWGYSDAFRLTWLVSIPFGVIATIVAFFVTDVSPYFTSHTAVTMEKERLGGGADGISEANGKSVDSA